jgi:hypothetical protein
VDVDLFRPGADWYAIGADLAASGTLLGIRALAALRDGDLWLTEVLSAHLHGQYLIGVHGAQAPEVARRLGAGEPLEDVWREVVRVSPDEWDARVATFLRERTAVEHRGGEGLERPRTPAPR